MTRKIIIIALVSFSCWSCKSDHQVSTPEKTFTQIIDQIGSDTLLAIRFDSSLLFSWDKMIILKPYQESSVKGCGFDINLSDSKILNTEGLEEYLFIKNKKLIRHIIHDNSGKKSIRLVIDKSIDNICGIDNSPALFVKLISDSSYDFSGKTFLIFKE